MITRGGGCRILKKGLKIKMYLSINGYLVFYVNPFNPEFTIVIFIHHKPRIAATHSRLVVDEDELMWFEN